MGSGPDLRERVEWRGASPSFARLVSHRVHVEPKRRAAPLTMNRSKSPAEAAKAMSALAVHYARRAEDPAEWRASELRDAAEGAAEAAAYYAAQARTESEQRAPDVDPLSPLTRELRQLDRERLLSSELHSLTWLGHCGGAA